MLVLIQCSPHRSPFVIELNCLQSTISIVASAFTSTFAYETCNLLIRQCGARLLMFLFYAHHSLCNFQQFWKSLLRINLFEWHKVQKEKCVLCSYMRSGCGHRQSGHLCVVLHPHVIHILVQRSVLVSFVLGIGFSVRYLMMFVLWTSPVYTHLLLSPSCAALRGVATHFSYPTTRCSMGACVSVVRLLERYRDI